MTEKQTFDVVMKRILSVSKPDMTRRLEADKRTRDGDPARRMKSAEKRPTRKPEL